MPATRSIRFKPVRRSIDAGLAKATHSLSPAYPSVRKGEAVMEHDKKEGAGAAFFDLILEKIKTLSNLLMLVLLIGLTLLLGASIGMRYFLGQPISWANAISRYAYIYIVLIGSAVSYMLEGHATIESFYNLMPRRIKILFDLAHYLIVMGLSVLLVVKGARYAMTMWPVKSPVMPFFSIGIVYLSVPISFLIIFLYMLRKSLGLVDLHRK
jgi:TRAP-type transport system small permease protein